MNNCQPNCGCKFEVDSSCVRYSGADLGTTSINTGDTVETSIIKIDQAITNLYQVINNNNQAPQISGPLDRVVKFGPPSTPLLPSQTIDDGYSIGINSNPDPTSKVLIETSSNQTALKSVSYNNGKEAITSINQSNGSAINKATVSLASGSTTSNIGIETSSTGNSVTNIGLSSTALGATNNYSVQLKDGTQTVNGGKFLKDKGEGKANWDYIYLADIQDYQLPNQYTLPIATNTILGGIKVGSGLSIDVQGILSTNIGQGTLNYVAKFTPNGTTIGDSQIQDNGTSVSINSAPLASSRFYVETSTQDWAAIFNNFNSGKVGIEGSSKGSGTGTNIGINGIGQGSSTLNIGVKGYATQSNTNNNVGGFFTAESGINNYSLQLKDGTEAEGKFLKSITSDGKANWASLVTDVTHAQLVGYVNGSQLTPGTYYRITDYQTIYEQPDYIDRLVPVTTPIIKTGPTQPLIVLALTNNTLSEEAYQEGFPKDTIKYRLVYNTKVTNTPTKGRIYERIDEYNNRTDFDHRNVLFKRYVSQDETLLYGKYFHYPFCQDNNIVEVLAITPGVNMNNVYIEGNWSNKGYFDLPNIVIVQRAINLKIGYCYDITILDAYHSEIKVSADVYIDLIQFTNIGSIGSSILNVLVRSSNFNEIANSVLLRYSGGAIINSNITNINLNSYGVDYTNITPPSIGSGNPYLLAGIPYPQKYPIKAILVDTWLQTNCTTIDNIFPTISTTFPINYRDGSKLYTGTSIFSQSSIYRNITVKDDIGSIVTTEGIVRTDSQGNIFSVYISDPSSSSLDSGGLSKSDHKYFYFETTTTNEVGKVPSNVQEQVKYIPNINNISDIFNMPPLSIIRSNINVLANSSLGYISSSDVNIISQCNFTAILSSNIREIVYVKSKFSGSKIDNTYITRFYDVSFENINNCFFKGVVIRTTFGKNFGSYIYQDIGTKSSSDEYIFETSSERYINPKIAHFTGNVFNSDISESTFGDNIYGNIFNCIVQDANIPDHFVNNEVNILLNRLNTTPTTYLSNFRELQEKTIKCKINPVFKTFSELSMPISVGTVYQYSQNEDPQYHRLYAKVFNIEPNYIDTVSRVWFVIDSEKLSLYPVPNYYDRASYLTSIIKKDNEYPETLPWWNYPKTNFGISNKLIGNTSVLVGKSLDNAALIRKQGYQYTTDEIGIISLVDSIAAGQQNSFGYYGNNSPNLDKMTIPTKGDLELIYSLNLIQRSDIVWSSSEIDASNAWAFDFATGQSVSRPKNTQLRIQPIINAIGVDTMELEYKRDSGIVIKQFNI